MPDSVQIDFNNHHVITETSMLWPLEPGEKSVPLKPPLEVAHPGMSTMTPDGHALVSMSNSYVTVYLRTQDGTAFEFHQTIDL